MRRTFIDCHAHIGVDPDFYLSGNFPYALDYRSHVDQMGRNGISRSVVFPFVSYFGHNALSVRPSSVDRFAVPYAFENRRMLEEIYEQTSDISDAAIPFAIVDPARQPIEQIVSLRALRESYPIRGLKIQATMIKSSIRSLLGEGSAVLELARDWDVPLLIHSSIAPEDVWSQCSDILDIAEAWPDVRICLAHSCRFDLPSLERLGSLPNTWVDCSAHCIHCDAVELGLGFVATPSNRLPADFTDPARVLEALAGLLPDRLIWGSDAPFYSYSGGKGDEMIRLTSSYEREIAALDRLTDDQKMAVLHDNTVRFFGESYV